MTDATAILIIEGLRQEANTAKELQARLTRTQAALERAKEQRDEILTSFNASMSLLPDSYNAELEEILNGRID